MDDKEFLKLTIKQSGLSVEQERFPAGALVVLAGDVIASGMSDSYPGYNHAECEVIDKAFQKIGKLSDATLYASMEPCLMCLMRAYWSGIRRIVYAINRSKLNQQYYEGLHKNEKEIENLNEPIEYLQITDLEEEALKVVRTWEGV